MLPVPLPPLATGLNLSTKPLFYMYVHLRKIYLSFDLTKTWIDIKISLKTHQHQGVGIVAAMGLLLFGWQMLSYVVPTVFELLLTSYFFFYLGLISLWTTCTCVACAGKSSFLEKDVIYLIETYFKKIINFWSSIFKFVVRSRLYACTVISRTTPL